jgi:hypothetical protein
MVLRLRIVGSTYAQRTCSRGFDEVIMLTADGLRSQRRGSALADSAKSIAA